MKHGGFIKVGRGKGVQNRPDDLTFIRPCNQIQFNPTSKMDL